MLSSLERLQVASFAITTFRYAGDPPETSVVRASTDYLRSFAWSGECEDCIQTVLSDENFRSRWVAVKTGQIEEMEGSGGRKYQFHPIPSLNRVEWHFVPEQIDLEVNVTDEEGSLSSARDSEEDS